jgi:hypothetical protein
MKNLLVKDREEGDDEGSLDHLPSHRMLRTHMTTTAKK